MIDVANDTILTPALELLPPRMDSKEARVMLLAICLQESRFLHRRQLVGNPPRPTGPAKGYWQFERGGGCLGVLTHPASRHLMMQICKDRGVAQNSAALWDAIEHDDILAAVAARLLLWTDPLRLPRDAENGWDTYIRVWRPGKPHRHTWDDFYSQAVEMVVGA
jgi:hypothetical protein